MIERKSQYNDVQEHAHAAEKDEKTAQIRNTAGGKDGSALITLAIASWVWVVKLVVWFSEVR